MVSMAERVQTQHVRREMNKPRSALIATEDMSAGTFLFWHVCQQIDFQLGFERTQWNVKLWNGMVQFGAGNIWLSSLNDDTMPSLADCDDKLYDHRFVNHCEMVPPNLKVGNIYLGPPEAANVPGVDDSGRIRPFFASRDIKAGEQLTWDFVYHANSSKYSQQNDGDVDKCICGVLAADCFDLKAIKEKRTKDPIIEKIYSDVHSVTDGEKLYLVKYR